MNQELINAINKAVKNSVVKEPITITTVVPTGSIFLDRAIGVGGFPGGRISELYGIESSGKSTVCLTAYRNAQRMGLNPIYIDMEASFDHDYAKLLGIDLDNLIVAQPDTAEDALLIIETALQNKSRFIVLDSVGAMSPHKESIGEGEIGDANVGLIARLMSQATRRLTPLVRSTDSVLLFTNQMRAKIGGVVSFGGPGMSTPGGHSLLHAYSLRIKLARMSTDMDGNVAESVKIKCDVTKNKVAPPFSKTDFEILFGTGIDCLGEILSIAVEQKEIIKKASWYQLPNGDSLGQGDSKAREYLQDNKELCRKIIERFCPYVKYDLYIK